MNRATSPIAATSRTQFGTMYDVMRYWADMTPNRPALVSGDAMPLSYDDLSRCVDTMGAALNDFGFGRNDRIGLVHPGGRDMAAAILGIWSYATPVPFNPGATLGELAIQFCDMGIKAVAIAAEMETSASAVANEFGLPILDLRPDGKGGVALTGISATPATKNPNTGPARPDDIIAVLGTSGTTSHSKIVPLRHRHLLYRNTIAARALGLTAADRCLNLLRLYHSGGLGQGLSTSLISGGSLGVLNDFSVSGIFEAMDAVRPTWCVAPYAIYSAIRPHLDAYRATIERVAPTLRFLRSGTGPLNPTAATAVERAFGVPIVVTYGSSEAGNMAGDSVAEIRPDRNSVGKPVHDGVAIFDDKGACVPVGSIGEIATRGPAVFEGYENDDAANRRGFFDGWFRSGDLGYLDRDGYLFITGRIKELINRGGQKVSPTEIDDALLAHPDTADAAAFPIAHPTLGEEVVAAVVTRDGATLERSELDQFLRDRLAAHKRPRQLFFVSEIPKGPTGKPQRHKLAEVFGAESPRNTASPSADFRHATAMERQLQNLWAEALGCDKVGLHDDFFALGGDSLLAVELFLRIEEKLGRKLPRTILFEASTVAEMAEALGASYRAACLVPIQPRGDKKPFFCVHGIDGDVLYFRDLANRLGRSQPFYGIRCEGLDGTTAPSMSIPSMAARYIEEMRSVQPYGPYRFGGYSFGGWIAHEMACQLARAGEEVALLVLIDTPCRPAGPGALFRNWLTWAPNDTQSNTLAAEPIRQSILSALRLHVLSAVARLGIAKRSLEARFRRYPAEANGIALKRHRPAVYAGDAVLLHSEHTSEKDLAVYGGWHRLTGGALVTKAVAGSHYDMMYEPSVAVLAWELASWLGENT